MKILIVDDDKDLALSLKKALSSEGYVVDTVGTGKEGSFIARTEKYDICADKLRVRISKYIYSCIFIHLGL